MLDPQARTANAQRAILVGAYAHPGHRIESESLLDELDELVTTLGLQVEDRLLVYHRETHPRFLLGTGKAEEIAALAREEKLDAIVFDNELTPSQQRNWEKLSGVAVLDRQEVI